MRIHRSVRLTAAAAVAAVCILTWALQAQSPVQIGPSSPLPVFVTNPSSNLLLPEGFVPGSRWRFTTWTTPSVFSWTATINRTAGAWANLTTVADDGTRTTRWYYVPNMPGSWERQ